MNNDWRDYKNDSYLAHHGVKGMKWGVRRYQNDDGSLNSAGKKRYSGTKVEKYLTKSEKYENKSANARTRLGSYINSGIAYRARLKADNAAAKSDNNYKWWAVNQNRSRKYAAAAETEAGIAKKMKARSEREMSINSKKAKKIMDRGVRYLSAAENTEDFARAYRSIAKEKNLFDKAVTSTNAMDEVYRTGYTKTGRRWTMGDRRVEGAIDSAASSITGHNLSGITGLIRDVKYKKNNSAEKRWDTILKNKKG